MEELDLFVYFDGSLIFYIWIDPELYILCDDSSVLDLGSFFLTVWFPKLELELDIGKQILTSEMMITYQLSEIFDKIGICRY